MSTMAAERLRGILERESALRLGLKRAKAQCFIALVQDGRKATEAWQELALNSELKALEDAYEAARIDLVVENAVNWGKLDRSGEEDEA
jgi:hypothetical protein